MRRTLHFICPTDCLESIINQTFSGEHYFFTSLGNSLTFDEETVSRVINLIETKDIRQISFILSNDNKIVLDALGNQIFGTLKGLYDFYHLLEKEKALAEDLWLHYNRPFLLSSCHLQQKIGELKAGLQNRSKSGLNIDAKIYKKQEGIFRRIYPKLILKRNLNLN